MERRIVVCMRFLGEPETAPEGELVALRQIVERAVAHGGRLVAWLPPLLACDFGVDAWEDALEMLRPECSVGAMAAGISEGDVEIVQEGSARMAVAWGECVTRAKRLAALAEAGEVLLAREVMAARERNLVATERRFVRREGRVLAGAKLDWRSPKPLESSEALGRLSPTAWVGVPPEQAVHFEPGHATVLHAPPGMGATRFFRELEGVHRHLRLGPGPAGEPLGALRRALARETDIAERFGQSERLAAAFGRLIAGAGLRPDDAAALVEGWCDAVGSHPVVFVEEPERVDADSVAAVMQGLPRISFVVRSREEEVPAAFAAIPLGPEIELQSLSQEEAGVAIQSMTAGSLAPTIALRYAKRGGFRPLGIVEAICAGLESNELAWIDGKLVARGRIAGRGRTRSPSYWIIKRLERLDPEGRSFLDMLAILGGEAEGVELAWLAGKGCFSPEIGPLTRRLHAARWVRRSGERLVSLSSDTLRRRLLETMSPGRRTELHQLAVELYGSMERPLLAGAAALHAALGGNPQRAMELGRKVGLLCRVNQLAETADAFERFGKRGEISELLQRSLNGGWDGAVTRDSELANVRPSAPVPSATRVAERARRKPPEPQASVETRDSARPRAMPGEGRLAEVLERTQALLEGAGAECRTHLVAALWQARGSNDSEALLHSLEALAVARRSSDRRGERACITLALALSRRSGAERAASIWQSQFDRLT